MGLKLTFTISFLYIFINLFQKTMRKLGLFLIFISFSSPGQILLDATGSANNFSVNYPANLNGTIPPGFTITFRSNQNVTGQAFLSVNGSTPVEIMRNFNSGLTANSIRMGQFVTVVYDNFNGIWQLMSAEASVPIPSQ